MKGVVKAVIAGSVILVFGVVIIFISFVFNGCSFGFKDIEFEMNRYEAVDENTSLEIDFGAGDLKTQYYDGDKIAIDYPTAKGYYSEITEGSGKLVFKTKIKLFFTNFRKLNIPQTVIYLPRGIVYDLDFDLGAGKAELAGGAYGKIQIHVGAGAAVLNDSECNVFKADVSAGVLTLNGLACNKFDADVSAGKLEIAALTCSTFGADVSAGKLEVRSVSCPDITADVSAGSAEIKVNGIKSEYTIRTSVSAGSCNVVPQTGTTNKRITVDVSAGSADIGFLG